MISKSNYDDISARVKVLRDFLMILRNFLRYRVHFFKAEVTFYDQDHGNAFNQRSGTFYDQGGVLRSMGLFYDIGCASF